MYTHLHTNTLCNTFTHIRRMHDQFSKDHLQNSICIVSSRPSFANKLKRKTHINIFGFDKKYIGYYLIQLPGNIIESIFHLWSKHLVIMEACH